MIVVVVGHALHEAGQLFRADTKAAHKSGSIVAHDDASCLLPQAGNGAREVGALVATVVVASGAAVVVAAGSVAVTAACDVVTALGVAGLVVVVTVVAVVVEVAVVVVSWHVLHMTLHAARNSAPNVVFEGQIALYLARHNAGFSGTPLHSGMQELHSTGQSFLASVPTTGLLQLSLLSFPHTDTGSNLRLHVPRVAVVTVLVVVVVAAIMEVGALVVAGVSSVVAATPLQRSASDNLLYTV